MASGWAQPLGRVATLRGLAHREFLFDLEAAGRRLFEREDKAADGNLLAKCAANLMRLWCDG